MNSRIVIAPGYESLRPLFEQIARGGGVPAGATTLYEGRNRVYRLSAGNTVLCIKSFHTPMALNRAVYGLLRKCKARRSYDNALRLAAAGIATPAPVACIECRTAGMLGRSYYISLLAEGYAEARYIEQRPDYDALAHSLAQIIHRLRSHGMLFADFSPGNVLWRRRAGGDIDMMLVDVNRMSFGVTDARKLDRMFGSIVESEDACAAIGRRYGRIAGTDPDEAARAAVEARRRFLASFYRKRRLKKLFLRKKYE